MAGLIFEPVTYSLVIFFFRAIKVAALLTCAPNVFCDVSNICIGICAKYANHSTLGKYRQPLDEIWSHAEYLLSTKRSMVDRRELEVLS